MIFQNIKYNKKERNKRVEIVRTLPAHNADPHTQSDGVFVFGFKFNYKFVIKTILIALKVKSNQICQNIKPFDADALIDIFFFI